MNTSAESSRVDNTSLSIRRANAQQRAFGSNNLASCYQLRLIIRRRNTLQLQLITFGKKIH